MKSLLLSISFTLITFGIGATEDPEAEAIYAQAKAAYVDNDCRSTVQLLTEYLTLTTPAPDKLAAIYAVIGWCSVYLEQGFSYRSFAGIMGSSKSKFDGQQNAFGREMIEYKQSLP